MPHTRPPFPDSVVAHLDRLLGDITDTQPLTTGQSGAGVWRVRSAAGSVIVKASPSRNETTFYREHAPALREQGIPSPDLLAAASVAGNYWLILEDIVQPLPRDRWLADRAVLATLARLHAATWDAPRTVPGGYVPSWPPEQTTAALGLLSADERPAVRALLGPISERTRPLFAPLCSISGDPNPTNWGLRPDGQSVLFDWERFTAGHPALDLAITVPGLGDHAAFRAVAERYLALTIPPIRDSIGPPAALARAIADAKVWTVIDYLAGFAEHDPADRPAHLPDIAAALSSWLATITGE